MIKTIKLSSNKPGGTASKGAKATKRIMIPTEFVKALELENEEQVSIRVED